jgi:hypothetical protein
MDAAYNPVIVAASKDTVPVKAGLADGALVPIIAVISVANDASLLIAMASSFKLFYSQLSKLLER